MLPDGSPFFWLADTGWGIFMRLDRQETDEYFADRAAVVLNFAETILPAGEISHLSGEDRTALVALQRWMTSARLFDTGLD